MIYFPVERRLDSAAAAHHPGKAGCALLPKIVVLALGGTIAMTKNQGDAGVQPSLTADDLVAAVPQLAEAAEVEARSFRSVPSTQLTLDDMVALAAEIQQAVDHGADGVVITQGTDTIEETAFALDLMLRVKAPVVVTGAMRHPALPGADGPANLLAAVQVAADPAALGCGVLVVMNDEIHAASLVQKRHTSGPAAFQSILGPLGWVTEGRVRILLYPGRRPHVPVVPGRFTPPAALVTVGMDDDGRLLQGVLEQGYKGLVVEGMGGGHVTPPMVERLADIARAIPVVIASRTGSGETLRQTYDYAGSELDLLRRGLIPAGILDGLKARVLLSLLLRSGIHRAHYADIFGQF